MAPDASSAQHSLAILDDYADTGRKHFAHIPNITVTVYKDTLSAKDPAQVSDLVERLRPYTIISCMRERTAFPGSLLSQLPHLRLLLTTGNRNASIDLAYCKTHSITVSGTTSSKTVYLDSDGKPTTGSAAAARTIQPVPAGHSSTTQHTLSLLLALTSRIVQDDARLKSDPMAWQSGLTMPLGGKILGIVGLGKLGAAFARIAVLALGMRVLAWSESLTPERAAETCKTLGLEAGAISAASKEDLFRQADVVSVHYVLSDRSRNLVGAPELARMKPGAVVVNTARGPIVDELALLDVLRRGKIRGAALDVYWSREPLEEDSPWRREKWGEDGRAQVVLSPHMGYVNEDTMEIWYAEQAADVQSWLADGTVKTPLW